MISGVFFVISTLDDDDDDDDVHPSPPPAAERPQRQTPPSERAAAHPSPGIVMGLLGSSVIVASLVYLLVCRPEWLLVPMLRWLGFGGATGPESAKAHEKEGREEPHTDKDTAPRIRNGATASNGSAHQQQQQQPGAASATEKTRRDMMAMPPPPPPPPTIQPPTIDEPDSPTTPKASAARPSQPVPTFTLSDVPSSKPAPSAMMPPPPRPSRLVPAGRVPSLPQFPAPNSAQRARGPVPNRGPPSSQTLSAGGGLAPPPTHSSKPQKPSKKIILDPGHSPLDWARISGPNADLRGLDDPSTPYLRVTPSMLKRQTGRKGKDAWMALNGKVYNVTPYAKFHPGGVPELMRGAGRDGTKLFGEIHPWVNYETMLAACLIGLLVEEPEPGKEESEMDKMD
ncbi:cytochrome b5 [Purpureocillium lavendulum]|uniref:Cytochrome b5 n=1 Tax=Purpureocillium lavendulum TaxID=1247861 RepID=A0AB34FU99_9HYPO|nr:cytochrome b5 [Purpureocillium lavendulum]